jgi:hypothetical protein
MPASVCTLVIYTIYIAHMAGMTGAHLQTQFLLIEMGSNQLCDRAGLKLRSS